MNRRESFLLNKYTFLFIKYFIKFLYFLLLFYAIGTSGLAIIIGTFVAIFIMPLFIATIISLSAFFSFML